MPHCICDSDSSACRFSSYIASCHLVHRSSLMRLYNLHVFLFMPHYAADSCACKSSKYSFHDFSCTGWYLICSHTSDVFLYMPPRRPLSRRRLLGSSNARRPPLHSPHPHLQRLLGAPAHNVAKRLSRSSLAGLSKRHRLASAGV